MEIAAEGLDRAAVYKIMAGSIVPRPIAWVTTRSEAGVVNAAPFSAFTLISQDPPLLLFQSGGGPREKDTARNIRLTGEFVVNIANMKLLKLMNLSSTPLPPEHSEPETFGIPLAPSLRVKPPRIVGAPVCYECKLHSSFDVGNEPHTVFIGEVLQFFIADEVYQNGKIDQHKLDPVARIGGPWYAPLGEHIYMPVPTTLKSDW